MSEVDADDLVYAGFWIRVWASIIDTVLLMLVLFPLLSFIPGVASTSHASGQMFTPSGQINYNAFGGALGMSMPGPLHILLFYVLPAVIVVLFWITRLATPGKMAIGAKIVDAKSGGKPTSGQYVLRYVGYFVSTLPFCLGLIWVGIDRRKQGWHDKMARTVVVRPRQAMLATARFDDAPADQRSQSAPKLGGRSETEINCRASLGWTMIIRKGVRRCPKTI